MPKLISDTTISSINNNKIVKEVAVNWTGFNFLTNSLVQNIYNIENKYDDEIEEEYDDEIEEEYDDEIEEEYDDVYDDTDLKVRKEREIQDNLSLESNIENDKFQSEYIQKLIINKLKENVIKNMDNLLFFPLNNKNILISYENIYHSIIEIYIALIARVEYWNKNNKSNKRIKTLLRTLKNKEKKFIKIEEEYKNKDTFSEEEVIELRKNFFYAINYISFIIFDFFINEKMAENSYNILRKNIDLTLKENWHNNFKVFYAEINKKITSFLKQFYKQNLGELDLVALKTLVIKLRISINNSWFKWKIKFDSSFDIFFSIIEEKFNSLLKSLELKNEFFEFSKYRVYNGFQNIINSDLKNLFNDYKKSIKKHNDAIEYFLKKLINKKQNLVNFFIPEFDSKIKYFNSFTLETLNNIFLTFTYETRSELYQKYNDIAKELILKYKEFIIDLEIEEKNKINSKVINNIIKFIKTLCSKIEEKTKEINHATVIEDLNNFYSKLVKYNQKIQSYIYYQQFYLEKENYFSKIKKMSKKDIEEWFDFADSLRKENKIALDKISSDIFTHNFLSSEGTIEANFLKLKTDILFKFNELKDKNLINFTERINKKDYLYSFANNIFFLKINEKINELSQNFRKFWTFLQKENLTLDQVIKIMQLYKPHFNLIIELSEQFNNNFIKLNVGFFIESLNKYFTEQKYLLLDFRTNYIWNKNENLAFLYENFGCFIEASTTKQIENISNFYKFFNKKNINYLDSFIEQISGHSIFIFEEITLISEETKQETSMKEEIIKSLQVYKKLIQNIDLNVSDFFSIHYTLFRNNLEISDKLILYFSSAAFNLEYKKMNSSKVNVDWFNNFIKKIYLLEAKNNILMKKIKKDIFLDIEFILDEKNKDIYVPDNIKKIIKKLESFALEFNLQNKHDFQDIFKLSEQKEGQILISFLKIEIENFEKFIKLISEKLKKSIDSIIKNKKLLILFYDELNAYTIKYLFIFQHLIFTNNICLKKLVDENEELAVKLLPSLEEKIKIFNDSYFNLIKSNFDIFKKFFLFEERTFPLENIDSYKDSWTELNLEIADIISLLSYKSVVYSETYIKSYMFSNINNFIKTKNEEQEQIIEKIHSNMKNQELIDTNIKLHKNMFEIYNHIQCLKIFLLPNIKFDFINNFETQDMINDLWAKIEEFKDKFIAKQSEMNNLENANFNPLLVETESNINSDLFITKMEEFIKFFNKNNELIFEKLFGEKNKNNYLKLFFKEQLNITNEILKYNFEKIKENSKSFDSILWRTAWYNFWNFSGWYMVATIDPIKENLGIIRKTILEGQTEINIKEVFVLNSNQIINNHVFFKRNIDNTTTIKIERQPVNVWTLEGNNPINVINFIAMFILTMAAIPLFNKGKIAVSISQPLVSTLALRDQIPMQDISFDSESLTSYMENYLSDSETWNSQINVEPDNLGIVSSSPSFSGGMADIICSPEKLLLPASSINTALLSKLSIWQKIANYFLFLISWNSGKEGKGTLRESFKFFEKFKNETKKLVFAHDLEYFQSLDYFFNSDSLNKIVKEVLNSSNTTEYFEIEKILNEDKKHEKDNKYETLEEKVQILENYQTKYYSDRDIQTFEEFVKIFTNDLDSIAFFIFFCLEKPVTLRELENQENLNANFNLQYEWLLKFLISSKSLLETQSLIKGDDFCLNKMQESLNELINLLSVQEWTNFNKAAIKRELYQYIDWGFTFLSFQNNNINFGNSKTKVQFLFKPEYKDITIKFENKNEDIIKTFFDEKNSKKFQELLDKELILPLKASLKEYLNDILTKQEIQISSKNDIDFTFLTNSFENFEKFIKNERENFLLRKGVDIKDLESLSKISFESMKEETEGYLQVVRYKTNPLNNSLETFKDVINNLKSDKISVENQPNLKLQIKKKKTNWLTKNFKTWEIITLLFGTLFFVSIPLIYLMIKKIKFTRKKTQNISDRIENALLETANKDSLNKTNPVVENQIIPETIENALLELEKQELIKPKKAQKKILHSNVK